MRTGVQGRGLPKKARGFIRGLGPAERTPRGHQITTLAAYEKWARDLSSSIEKKRAEIAKKRGEIAVLGSEIDDLTAQLASVNEWANRAQGRGGLDRDHGPPLPGRVQGSSVTKVSPDQHSLETSRGKAKGNALIIAANRRGLTLRALATAVSGRIGRPMSHSLLSMIYRGDRPLREDVRQAVEDLIGFSSWPRHQ